jgi:hypothetical protein
MAGTPIARSYHILLRRGFCYLINSARLRGDMAILRQRVVLTRRREEGSGEVPCRLLRPVALFLTTW